jgi:hypothetical protein
MENADPQQAAIAAMMARRAGAKKTGSNVKSEAVRCAAESSKGKKIKKKGGAHVQTAPNESWAVSH